MAVTKLCEGCGKGVEIHGYIHAMTLHQEGWFACGKCRERRKRGVVRGREAKKA
ncbi:MAG TPA: hypothetical protein VL500_07485 [Candidatus Eisenbacteria bacterium]|jgi:hypothetical protein|nr:hypothetical protein [Candidatus Eisenbacteria bacterium]